MRILIGLVAVVCVAAAGSIVKTRVGDVVVVEERRQQKLDCSSVGMTKSLRQLLLTFHNDMREAIARGMEAHSKGMLPRAAQMYAVDWSCSLEAQAQKWAAKCDQVDGLALKDANIAYVAATSDSSADVVKVLQGWRREAAGEDMTTLTAKAAVRHWAAMAHDQTSKIGCSIGKCSGGKMTLVCVMDKTVADGAVVYKSGTPCSYDRECSANANSHCVPLDRLCHSDAQPITSNEICANTKMNDAARVSVLEWHNSHRSGLAQGIMEDAEGGNAPMAADMTKMNYDCGLEMTAQEMVDTCKLTKNRQISSNFFMTTSEETIDQISLLQQASSSWWSELRMIGIGSANTFTTSMMQMGNTKYSQMAWSTTNRLGCATAACSGKYIVACVYAPAGNRLNAVIYEKGQPCEKCTTSQTCSKKEGLCVEKL